MGKLNCILFVDDDVATTYLHKRLINKMEITSHLVTCKNGKEALDYISNPDAPGFVKPELILLDVNMPVMDGFEFLRAYQALDAEKQVLDVIMMLTSSLLDGDIEYADDLGVAEYIDKPLTERKLRTLIQQYFAEVE